MKVLVDARTRRIPGDEVVHVLLDAIAHSITATALARTMHIHPTVAELVPTLLQDLRPLQERA